MSMDELIRAMMQGQQPQRRAGAEDPLSAILGSILGGAGQAGGRQSAQGGDLGSLLEAILGSGMAQPSAGQGVGAQAGAGGLMDILGAVLGGGGGATGLEGLFGPMIAELAQKLGLPPQIAQMVITFVLSKLLAGQQGAGPTPAPATSPSAGTRRSSKSAGPAGLDLDSLLERMNSPEGLDARFLKSTGMVDELAQQTGLDPQTATRSLQEVFGMLGAQMGGQSAGQDQAQKQSQGLDHLLDKW